MFSVTTVSHKTSDCQHPLVMLTSREGNRYFFGKIPEGVQRVLNENGFRLGRLKSIFVTGIVSQWSDIGGLPGLFLTISDATSRGIDVFTNSSKVFSYVVATWRYFVFRKGIGLNVLDTDQESLIGDTNVAFHPIKISPSVCAQSGEPKQSQSLVRQITKLVSLMFPTDTRSVNSSDPESYKSDPSETDLQTQVALPDPSELVEIKTQKSLNFIIRLLPVRGKFDAVKAKELGIKPGFNYKRLADGESVENDKGELVHPHQVLAPPKTFPKVLILDIPNNDYLDNTINSQEWFAKPEERGPENYGLVYHFLGDDIDIDSPKYLDFISKFPSECEHVISHSSIADDTLVFKTFAVHLLKLKSIMNNHFSVPYFEEHKPLPKHTKLQSLQKFSISPAGVTKSEDNVISLTLESLQRENSSPSEKNVHAVENIVLPLTPEPSDSLKDQVQIVTLGTGSALPSIHRNVLSNLIRIPYVDSLTREIKYNAILLDGGENTIGSLMRNYGHNNKAQLKQIYSELSLIFLSHLHADHHLGIISIIGAWYKHNKDNSRKLYLVVPWQYNNFVMEWFRLEKYTSAIDMQRIVYVSCEQFVRNPESEFRQMNLDDFEERLNKCTKQPISKTEFIPLTAGERQKIFDDLRISSMRTVRATHCYWAYSVSIKFQLDESETFKVSFSGDTRPNTKFVDIGRNSDLLIHEASLDNELIEEALAKKHTTIVEAIKISMLMYCPKLILTHFSARFSEKHSFIENAQQYEAAAQNMKTYLGSTASNIFQTSRPQELGFEDLDICYAYDMLTMWYRDLGFQKPHFAAINDLSGSEADEKAKAKEEKEMAKKYEKKASQRAQRLAMGRKRKLSHDLEKLD